MTDTQQAVNLVATNLGLTMTTVFVPWSRSRNKAEKQPSLNWEITLHKSGKPILTTDYMAGCGHCPSYKQGTNSQSKIIEKECETGYKHATGYGDQVRQVSNRRIEVDFADVLHSLTLDSDVIDYGTFEEWAESMGYDTDSRKAESIYRACLGIALSLRNAIGDDGLKAIREVLADY